MKQADSIQRRVETVRIVGIYAIFGLAWIYGSDQVVDWMFDDRTLLVKIAVAKGFLFIICTAALLYFLISRYLEKLAAAERERLEILDNYQTIFNATNEAIFLHDIDDGRIIDVNQRVLEMYGYSREESLASDIGQFCAGITPYTRAEAFAKVHRTIDEGPQVFQWLSRRKNGEQFWVEISLKRITTRGRLAIVAVVRDVTERKRQEDAIKEKNAHLRFFFEYAPASLAMFDTKMRYLQVSRRWQSMYGLNDRNLIGLSHYDVFPEVTERWKEFHRRGLAGEILREEADPFVRADGTVQWVRWEIRPWYEAVDRVGGIVIFTEDITQKKLIEDALSANERFLRMLTDQLPGMVGYWDSELRCTFANKAYQEWFGKSTVQMIGITLPELLGEELFAQNEPFVRKALAGQTQRFERTLVKPGGEVGYTWAHYIPDKVGGVTRGFYVLISDVTELKLAEQEKVQLESQLQQAQKLESVGRLAGGVAHDFNNLLTVILGLAQLGMRELEPGDPARSRMEGIRQAAEKSAALTQQLLGFARKQTIAPRVLELNHTVEQMLSMLRRLVGENIEVVWRPGKGLWRINMDPSQLDQILANLCVNARDAIEDVGRITIETTNARFDKAYCAANFGFLPGEYVQLTVSDDGCGMEKEMIAHIFEPFFTTKKMGKGTGLGLATLYGIVKQNNGFINTYSELGEGTTFKIYFPRHDAARAETPPESAERPASRGHETILLVEDEPTIREVAVSLLQLQGYRVLAAALPHEAVELARVHADEIDLVMTDVVMPEMNGRELARTLQSICPRMKCLFMSGYTANVIAHHGVLDEGVNFISKPFSLSDLAEKVREVLDACPPSQREIVK